MALKICLWGQAFSLPPGFCPASANNADCLIGPMRPICLNQGRPEDRPQRRSAAPQHEVRKFRRRWAEACDLELLHSAHAVTRTTIQVTGQCSCESKMGSYFRAARRGRGSSFLRIPSTLRTTIAKYLCLFVPRPQSPDGPTPSGPDFACSIVCQDPRNRVGDCLRGNELDAAKQTNARTRTNAPPGRQTPSP